ncbi:MAG: wax ester/triacylglycerol synthase domain-containing protein [Ilumatobacteraceae bacterium]
MADQRRPREQRFERRMSDAEALMWNIEKDPWLNPSGGSLILLDQPLHIEHFRAQITSTVAAVPRLRERVVPGVGRFRPPSWRADREFDLDYHIRQVALPHPGDERQLLDLVASVYQDPYDRTRPLWMFFVIEGLVGGRGALVWKIHHAVADGIGAGRLAESFLQPIRDAPTAPAVPLDAIIAEAVAADAEAAGSTSTAGMIAGTVTHVARRQAGIARRAMGEAAMWSADPLRARDTAGSAVRTVRLVREQLAGSDDEGGGSPLWRQRSRRRHLELLTFPLDRALGAAKVLGGSLNDWFVTGAIDGAVGYHDERGVPLTTLNTSFVVSTRTDRAVGGNSFTPSRLAVPAGPMDPVDRFAEISARMRTNRSNVSGSGLLSGLAGIINLLPTSFVTSTARSRAAAMDFATSNLRGSAVPLYISGALVEGNHPFGPVAGTAFNLTVMSYDGQLGMGLFVDPAAVEDPAGLREHLRTAYDALCAAAGT